MGLILKNLFEFALGPVIYNLLFQTLLGIHWTRLTAAKMSTDKNSYKIPRFYQSDEQIEAFFIF